MARILITGGRVIDPATKTDRIADVAIADGKVAEIAPPHAPTLSRTPADRVIDADGLIVAPGLIDPHVHLREPGGERAETIATGTAAAVAGGFSAVCCMPNTAPALDNDAMIQFIRARAEQTGQCRVFAVGAATKGRKGEDLAEISLMAREGAVGFSDDGDGIASAGVMLKALMACKHAGRAFMQHCQEPTLTRGAVMHAGSVSTRLGLTGWPRVAEEVMIERDILLNRAVGCRYHIQHMSSAGSVEIVRRAKKDHQPVSAEVSPHHLLLTHDAVDTHGGYWTHAKMNPPLREQSDIDALKKGIADGTIEVLATDHAPHTAEGKALEFDAAPFGIIGLETALPLYIEALVTDGVIAWPRLIELLTLAPARLCGLDGMGLGMLKVGGPADVTVIDPNEAWTITTEDLAGRSRNTPFLGRAVKGRAVSVIVGGVVRLESRATAA